MIWPFCVTTCESLMGYWRHRNSELRDFPGGPVVRTLSSQCRLPGFNPLLGNLSHTPQLKLSAASYILTNKIKQLKKKKKKVSPSITSKAPALRGRISISTILRHLYRNLGGNRKIGHGSYLLGTYNQERKDLYP